MDDRDIDVFDLMEILRQTVGVDIGLVAHIINAVDNLQQHGAHVVDQREEHHLEIVGVVSNLLGVKFGDIAEILQHDGHGLTELLLQLLDAHIFLIIDSMQERGHHGDIAQAHLQDGDACHLDKVQHIGLARHQIASVVFLQAIAIGLVNQSQVFRRIDEGVDVVKHRGIGLLDGQYF